MITIDGAVCCITGGARGIGKATAAELARRGAKVWIGDLDIAEAERTAAEIGASAVHLDVTDPASVAAFRDAAGVDGPPERPAAPKTAPKSNVSISGHAMMGVMTEL